MPIQNQDYISSTGKRTPLKELPYRYLVNIRAKADRENDQDAVKVLDMEINSRPKP